MQCGQHIPGMRAGVSSWRAGRGRGLISQTRPGGEGAENALRRLWGVSACDVSHCSTPPPHTHTPSQAPCSPLCSFPSPGSFSPVSDRQIIVKQEEEEADEETSLCKSDSFLWLFALNAHIQPGKGYSPDASVYRNGAVWGIVDSGERTAAQGVGGQRSVRQCTSPDTQVQLVHSSTCQCSLDRKIAPW